MNNKLGVTYTYTRLLSHARPLLAGGRFRYTPGRPIVVLTHRPPYLSEMPLFLYLKEFLYFQHLPKFKKKHHRSIHNIRLQMIIDNHVFEFSNTCTVGASMVVHVVSSITYDASRPPASGRVLECLPATACGPTAPVSHRLNFTPYISFLYIPLCIQVLYRGNAIETRYKEQGLYLLLIGVKSVI